jgi:hypothetical protein
VPFPPFKNSIADLAHTRERKKERRRTTTTTTTTKTNTDKKEDPSEKRSNVLFLLDFRLVQLHHGVRAVRPAIDAVLLL